MPCLDGWAARLTFPVALMKTMTSISVSSLLWWPFDGQGCLSLHRQVEEVTC